MSVWVKLRGLKGAVRRKCRYITAWECRPMQRLVSSRKIMFLCCTFLILVIGLKLTISSGNSSVISVLPFDDWRMTSGYYESLSWNKPEADNIIVNSTLSKLMHQKTRILCLVTTTPTYINSKARAVNNTWGKRCNKVLYITTERNNNFNILLVHMRESRYNLTAKTVAALSYAYKYYRNDYDWILKADDDVYIIMENLRYFLSHLDSNQPSFVGHHFKVWVHNGYMSGGGSYVMSKKALRTLVEEGYNRGICSSSGPDEDVDTGKCLEKVGVLPYSSLDMFGRETFHPQTLTDHVVGPAVAYLKTYSRNMPKIGKDCCSQLSISFHYVKPDMMYNIEFLLYRISVYGWETKIERRDFFRVEPSTVEHRDGSDIIKP